MSSRPTRAHASKKVDVTYKVDSVNLARRLSNVKIILLVFATTGRGKETLE